MALFWHSFCWCVDIGFQTITSAGMHWFYWKFAGYIIVKYRISNRLQNFGWVMALFRPSFCWCDDIGFNSITFAGMHWFYLKFSEGFIVVKYMSGLILVIIHKILAQLWHFKLDGTMSLESLCCHPVVGIGICVGVRVSLRDSTMFKFSKVCIVFNCLRYCFHIWPTPTLG